MMRAVRCCVLGLACVAFALCSQAESKGVESAQLVTYVEPVLPANVPAGGFHSVSFTAVLGADGKLRDLVSTVPDSSMVAAAKTAVVQWVYVPYKRKGKPIDKDVYVTVYLSGHQHEATIDHPVRVSGGVMERLVENTPAPLRTPGASGSVVLMGTIARDGSVEDVKAMSGPESMSDPALRAVRGWSYRPYLMDGVPVEIETTMRVNFGQ